MKIIRHFCDLCILIVLTERRFSSLKYNKDNSKIAVMLNIVTVLGIKSVLLYCTLFLWSTWILSWMDETKRKKRGPFCTKRFWVLILIPSAMRVIQNNLCRRGQNGTIVLQKTWFAIFVTCTALFKHQCTKIAQHLKHVWAAVLNDITMWQNLCLKMVFLISPETF